jgi:hypothetical protein
MTAAESIAIVDGVQHGDSGLPRNFQCAIFENEDGGLQMVYLPPREYELAALMARGFACCKKAGC